MSLFEGPVVQFWKIVCTFSKIFDIFCRFEHIWGLTPFLGIVLHVLRGIVDYVCTERHVGRALMSCSASGKAGGRAALLYRETGQAQLIIYHVLADEKM